jgi:hypothetical protein
MAIPQASNIALPVYPSCSAELVAADCSGDNFGGLPFVVDASKSTQSCTGPALVKSLNLSCLTACPCNSYYASSNMQCSTCQPCPIGGNCSADAVLAFAGHWGAFDPVTGVVSFAQCPTGYCCDGHTWPCTELKSCAGYRTGQLCGDCLPGFTASIGSEHCIGIRSCKRSLTPLASVSFFAFIVAALVQLVPVSGVWLPATTFPSGKAKLIIFFAQVLQLPVACMATRHLRGAVMRACIFFTLLNQLFHVPPSTTPPLPPVSLCACTHIVPRCRHARCPPMLS